MVVNKYSPNVMSRLKKELSTYRELMAYLDTNPNEEYIMKHIELLKINVSRCVKKIAEETKKYTNNMIPKDAIEDIKTEFNYKDSVRKLEYLNYLIN